MLDRKRSAIYDELSSEAPGRISIADSPDAFAGGTNIRSHDHCDRPVPEVEQMPGRVAESDVMIGEHISRWDVRWQGPINNHNRDLGLAKGCQHFRIVFSGWEKNQPVYLSLPQQPNAFGVNCRPRVKSSIACADKPSFA